MREKRLVVDGSFCDTNLYKDGPQTVSEARRQGKSLCPYFEKCNTPGFLDNRTGHHCIMMMGLSVAQHSITDGQGLAKELNECKSERPKPRKGWIYSKDRKHFEVIPEGPRVDRLIAEMAHVALGTEGEKTRTSRKVTVVGPSFEDVVAYSMTKGGAIDLAKMQSLEGRFGRNGGRGCDVRSGPCSCGAWH